jgi:hypothetical protein
MLTGKHRWGAMMFWLQLYGVGIDRKPSGSEQLVKSFPSPAEALREGRALSKSMTFYFGKAVGYRIINEENKTIQEGPF